jgi:hypothetical protein
MKQFTVPSSFKMLVAGGSWIGELHYMAAKRKNKKSLGSKLQQQKIRSLRSKSQQLRTGSVI